MGINSKILVILAIFVIILTVGCTNSSNSYAIEKTTPSSESNVDTQNSITPTENTPAKSDYSNQYSSISTNPTSVSQPSSPKYHAGMIISDDEGNLKLVTVYKSISGKYCTRSILKSNDGEGYLTKDSSFKELGSAYDTFKSIDQKYPVLYDDLNSNPDRYPYSYYNYKTKTGNLVYIFTNSAEPKLIGYLSPDSDESMEFVNTN